MLEAWRQKKVEELIKEKVLSIGDGYRAKNSELSNSGLPFARAANINQGFLFDNAECLDNSNLPKAKEKISQIGDVVFTSKGTVGRFGFVKENTRKFVYSPQLCYWRVLNKEIIEPRFLYFWMHGQEFFKQSSGVKGLTDMADYVSLSNQRRFYITLPPIEEQRYIAEILSALDEKIELNLQMNATLEKIAQVTFKQLNESSDKVLLRNYVELNPRLSIKKDQLVKYVEMSDLSEKGASIKGYAYRPFTAGSKFQQFDTLLARITPCLENGKTAFVDFLKGDEIAFGSTEFIVMRGKDFVSPYYVYLLSRNENFREFAIKSMVGSSGRQRVQVDMINNFELSKIEKDKMKTFHLAVKPMFEKMQENSIQIKTLTQIRDGLLPKLMSGKIRVAE